MIRRDTNASFWSEKVKIKINEYKDWQIRTGLFSSTDNWRKVTLWYFQSHYRKKPLQILIPPRGEGFDSIEQVGEDLTDVDRGYLSPKTYSLLVKAQKETPVLVFDGSLWGMIKPTINRLKWYYYKDEFWITNEIHYDSEDMKHLIDELLIKEQEKVKKAKRKINAHTNVPEEGSRRISKDVMDRVWNRDGGKCVECGSNENLEFDHIIPFSKGGANTYRNLQLLCEDCNREKSNEIG